MLSLLEELYLLALNEEKGSIFPFVKKNLGYALAGAILSELALQEKVCSNEKYRLVGLGKEPTGMEILDDVLKQVESADKARKLAYWINTLSEQPKKLRERVGETLVAKGVLVQDEKRFYRAAPTSENEIVVWPSRYEIKLPLRAMLFSNGELYYRRLALLGVMAASGMLSLVFTEDELPPARHRIHEKILSAALDNQAMQTIEEVVEAVASVVEDDSD